jgi:hypothetical protein
VPISGTKVGHLVFIDQLDVLYPDLTGAIIVKMESSDAQVVETSPTPRRTLRRSTRSSSRREPRARRIRRSANYDLTISGTVLLRAVCGSDGQRLRDGGTDTDTYPDCDQRPDADSSPDCHIVRHGRGHAHADPDCRAVGHPDGNRGCSDSDVDNLMFRGYPVPLRFADRLPG